MQINFVIAQLSDQTVMVNKFFLGVERTSQVNTFLFIFYAKIFLKQFLKN